HAELDPLRREGLRGAPEDSLALERGEPGTSVDIVDRSKLRARGEWTRLPRRVFDLERFLARIDGAGSERARSRQSEDSQRLRGLFLREQEIVMKDGGLSERRDQEQESGPVFLGHS